MDMVNLINQGITSGELTLLAGTYNDTTNDRAMDDKTHTSGAPQQRQNPDQQQ